MTTKNLTGWLLILGPATVFLLQAILGSIIIGQAETPAEHVANLMANQTAAIIITTIGALGFVAAFIGTILLLESMIGEGKPGGIFAKMSAIIFFALTALAIVASMVDSASLAAVQKEVGDTAEIAAQKVASAVTMQLVGNVIWSGLFFFWGIGFVLGGIALVMQKRLHLIVDWLFVIFGALFVILSVIPIDLAQNIGLIIFGLMVLNTIASGVLVLKEKHTS